jgi:hypothetical protein
MTEQIPFTGKVVRTEPGGFGIVEFDNPVGPAANNYGVVSASSGTTATGGVTFTQLREGVRVYGTVEADNRKVAVVKIISIRRCD